MSYPPPSAPPPGPGYNYPPPAPQTGYPQATYPPGQPSPGSDLPPPYYPTPPQQQASPLPPKGNSSQGQVYLPAPGQPNYATSQPSCLPPYSQPAYSSAQAPQPGYQHPAPQTYQHPQSNYQPPPVAGYHLPQPGYQPPQSTYQPPQPGYQPPQSTYQPPQPGYQPPQSTYQPPQPGYQPPAPPPQAQGYGAPQLSSQMAGMSLQPRAGDSLILSSFTDGNIVILESCSSGKSLRINQAEDVEGVGGRGKFAQFCVHVRRPGVVALQSVQAPEDWLAIYQGKTIGTGKGGPFCDFLLNEVEGRYVCLESALSPGQYVGILPDGRVKPPENTKTGLHGRFIVSLHTSVSPPTKSPQALKSLFTEGSIVILQSFSSGKSLKITESGNVTGRGGQNTMSQFRVYVRRPGVVALQNINAPQNWLAIHQEKTIGTGKGGLYCDFELKEVDGQYICLESVMFPGQHVGILPDGKVKSPAKTGRGPHGRFTATVHVYSPGTTAKHTHQAKPTSSVNSSFMDGNVVILKSCSSGKSLRINQNCDVEGVGGRGKFAQFRVHVRRPGVVALQNIHTPENWLAIYQGKTIGTGKGGQYCELKLTEVEGCYVCLESALSPGQYVGILPDGRVKPPENTKTGLHGRFIVSVHQ